MMMVTCAGLAAAISAALSGATITLEPGSDCAAFKVRDRDFGNAGLTLVLDGATVRGIEVLRSRGVRIQGGTLRAPDGKFGVALNGYSIRIRDSAFVTVQDAWFTDARIGAVIVDSQNIRLLDNEFSGVRSDGVNIARTSRVRVENNRMFDFSPIRRTCTFPDGTVEVGWFSKQDCENGGGVWKDGDHPDGVQMWDSVTDVQVIGNELSGEMQGIGRLGTLGSGIFRIVVDNNRMNLSFPRGISLEYCNDCQAVGNDVQSNGEGQFPTRILTVGSTGLFCANVVPAMSPTDPVVLPCP